MGKTSVVSRFNIPGRLAWLTMELPGPLIFLYIMYTLPAEQGIKQLPWENKVMAGIYVSYAPFIWPRRDPSTYTYKTNTTNTHPRRSTTSTARVCTPSSRHPSPLTMPSPGASASTSRRRTPSSSLAGLAATGQPHAPTGSRTRPASLTAHAWGSA